jgi:RTX calcium-binding nonapeptide repeat (4 copies)/GDSL-like Lipase/Acylhydrolase
MARPLFDEIYAVGDSLSDSGGIFQLSSQALSLATAAGVDTQGLQPIPVSPPYAGKFSNGPVLPEITAELLNATLINFSFGGAAALGKQTLLDAAGSAIPDQVQAAIDALPPPERAPIEAVLGHNINLPGQVADLVAATSAQPPSADSALVSLIGLNDLRGLVATFDPNNPLPLLQVIDGVVQANLAVAHTAFDHGIGTVIFETLPAPSFFPIANQLPPALQAIGDAAVDAVNLGLEAGALGLRLEGHDVRVVDLARMADEVSADPGTFGFLSLDEPTLLGNGIEFTVNPAAPPVEQTAFFDPLHATTNLHGVLAAFSAESLTSHTDFRGGGNDFIIGSSGDDLVLAGAGNDQVSLGRGNDILLAGLGNDVADGGQGSDVIAGGAGNDRLSGGNGSDVLAGNAGDDTLDGGNGNDALIDGLGSDTLFGGNGDDLFFATQAQLLGGSGTDTDHFDGGAGFDTLALLLDPATLAVEQADVAANFVAGHPFTFSSMDLTITGIEQIVLTTKFGFDDVPRPGGELGERLHEADLFGLV